MAAPSFPHPPRILLLFCLGLVAAVSAIPVARREDLLGRLAFIVLAVVAVALWGILAYGIVRSVLAWSRDKPIEPGDPRVGECYPGCVYTLSWDHQSFTVRTHTGEPMVQVPLAEVVDIIDMDALLLAADVTVRTPRTPVTFPKSRSERHKLFRLLGDLAGSGGEAHRAITANAVRLQRQCAIWFPISLLTAGLLILPIFWLPTPEWPNLFWVVVGVAYGLSWGWALRRFGYSVACFFGARKLHSMLQPKGTPTARA